MFLSLFLFLAGIYFLRNGLSLLLLRLPVRKADTLKLLTMFSAFVLACSWLEQGLYFVVKYYGGSLFGLTVDSMPFYLILLLLVFFNALDTRARNKLSHLLANSIAVMGVQKSHALPVLYEVLDAQGLSYQKRMDGVNLPEKDIDIKVELKKSEIRFHVSQAIDKLYLEVLCKAYQEHYRSLKRPLANTYAVLATLAGLSFLLVAAFIMMYWVIIPISGPFHSS